MDQIKRVTAESFQRSSVYEGGRKRTEFTYNKRDGQCYSIEEEDRRYSNTLKV